MAVENIKFNVRFLGGEAQRFGLGAGEVADILEKWGPAVLSTVVAGLRHGLSIAFIQEVLALLGPVFLEQAVNKFKNKAGFKLQSSVVSEALDAWSTEAAEEEAEFGDPIIQAEEVKSFDGVGPVIVDLLAKLLPSLIEKYGDAILKWIIDKLLASLRDRETKAAVSAALSDLVANS